MAPNTRRTKRKSFEIETEAERRNRLRKERQGEPSKQAEEVVQPPVDAPVPPPIIDENLNLPIVIYSPPSYKRYMVGRMVEENPMHEPVVEEEAVPPEEEAKEGDEVVGMEEVERAIAPPEEEGKEGDEGLGIEVEEAGGGAVAPEEQAEEEQQREVEGEGENEFVQAENEVPLQTAGEGDPGEDNSRTVSDAREVKFIV